MTTNYKYSLSNHFFGNLNTTQLKDAINESTSIIPQCLSVANKLDDVKIFFESALTLVQKIALDGLVSSHIPDNSVPKIKFFTIDPKKDGTRSKNFSKIGAFKYNGSKQMGIINYIEVLSFMQSDATSYSVRVLDKTNNKIVAEKNGLINTIEQIIDLGTISNIPEQQAIFELQAKITSNSRKFVYIDSLNFYYGN